MIKPNYTYKGICTNVVDGDTLDIDLDVGFRLKANLRLRLARVNTPELNSKDEATRAKAMDALKYVVATVLFKDLVVITTKADAFGRYLAEVYYVDATGVQRSINDDLLNAGLAVPYVK